MGYLKIRGTGVPSFSMNETYGNSSAQRNASKKMNGGYHLCRASTGLWVG